MYRLAVLSLALLLLPAVPASAQNGAGEFEIVLVPHSQIRSVTPLRVRADHLRLPNHHYGLAELVRGTSLVGVVHLNQVLLIVDRRARGERTFLVEAQNETHEVSADRMTVAQQNGPVLFWEDGRIVAVANANQQLIITDLAARAPESTPRR